MTLLGVALVPVFLNFRTIYEAHGAFTAAVTPPLVITLLLAAFWKRFTATAARVTLVGGMTQYKYMRAFFGIAVCAVLAVGTALLTRPEPAERRRGLVSGEPAEDGKEVRK